MVDVHPIDVPVTRERAPITHHESREAPGGHLSPPLTSLATPTPAWKRVLWRVYDGITDDRVMENAAAVSFYALLALFPAIGALVSIYGLFADPNAIAGHLDIFHGVLPGGAIDVIRDQLNRVASQPSGKLGLSFIVGLAISLWSANGGVKALFDALNMVYEEREDRSFLRLNAVSLAFTAAMILFLIAALVGLVAIPVVLDFLPDYADGMVDLARWPAMLVLLALVLACIYRFGPSRSEPRWRWISWGNLFAAAGWVIASALFSWYAANFGNFNKTYGSLGAVIGFMMWMWISVMVILIGGKLNAETEPKPAKSRTPSDHPR